MEEASNVSDESGATFELIGKLERLDVNDTDTLVCDFLKYSEPVRLSCDQLRDEVKDIDKADMLKHIAELKAASFADNKYKISSRNEKTAVYVGKTRRFAYNGKTRTTEADYTLITVILNKLEHNLENSVRGVNPRHLYYLAKVEMAKVEMAGSSKNQKITMKNLIKIVDDLCCFWSCTRSSLGMNYSPSSSSFGGCLSIKETDMDGNEIITDCTNMAKPYAIDMNSTFKIEKSTTHPAAKFILVLEKNTVFERLIRENKFAHDYRCILVSSNGQPDLQCRLFVRKLYESLQIPVLILVDFNVYGIEIVKSYMVGSFGMAFQSSRLVIPTIKFLGLSGDDLKKFGVEPEHLQPMSQMERKKILKLSQETWLTEDIKSSLELNLTWDKRGDIEILEIVHGYYYLSNDYLPTKLKELGLA